VLRTYHSSGLHVAKAKGTHFNSPSCHRYQRTPFFRLFCLPWPCLPRARSKGRGSAHPGLLQLQASVRRLPLAARDSFCLGMSDWQTPQVAHHLPVPGSVQSLFLLQLAFARTSTYHVHRPACQAQRLPRVKTAHTLHNQSLSPLPFFAVPRSSAFGRPSVFSSICLPFLPFITLLSPAISRAPSTPQPFAWNSEQMTMSNKKAAMDRDRVLTPRCVESMIANGHTIVILDNLVLRLDSWLDRHPGGRLAILHMVGKDATDEIQA
jgi:hypothetical protein